MYSLHYCILYLHWGGWRVNVEYCHIFQSHGWSGIVIFMFFWGCDFVPCFPRDKSLKSIISWIPTKPSASARDLKYSSVRPKRALGQHGVSCSLGGCLGSPIQIRFVCWLPSSMKNVRHKWNFRLNQNATQNSEPRSWRDPQCVNNEISCSIRMQRRTQNLVPEEILSV